MKYETKTYGVGFAVKNVHPKEEMASVMNYLVTGYPLHGHSMEGVTWEEVVDDEYLKIQEQRNKALARSLKVTQEMNHKHTLNMIEE